MSTMTTMLMNPLLEKQNMFRPIVRSVDLCSGIGGNALAFLSFAEPSMYCDIDQSVVDILNSIIDRGLLPRAHISRDVRLASIPKGTRFLSCSWPCQDNSAAGKYHGTGGMHGERSGLIKNVVGLILSSRPDIIFLENTPLVTANGSVDFVLRSLPGYDIAWGRMHACDVGYPHERARFFAVGVRRRAFSRALLRVCVHRSKAYTFSKQGEPRRLVPRTAQNTARCRALGNAVVPACSKTAFEVLGRILLRRRVEGPCTASDGRLPPWGAQLGGRRHLLRKPTFPRAATNIILDPAAYSPPAGHTNQRNLGKLLLVPSVRTVWSTPRHGNTHACHVLSERSVRDIGTQARFERSTPEEHRSGQPNAEFLEHIMGFPIGWTGAGDVACMTLVPKDPRDA